MSKSESSHLAPLTDGRTEVDLIVQHGVVITMDAAKTVLFDGEIAVDDGRIVSVGCTCEVTEKYTGSKTIDAHHRAVLHLWQGERPASAFYLQQGAYEFIRDID